MLVVSLLILVFFYRFGMTDLARDFVVLVVWPGVEVVLYGFLTEDLFGDMVLRVVGHNVVVRFALVDEWARSASYAERRLWCSVMKLKLDGMLDNEDMDGFGAALTRPWRLQQHEKTQIVEALIMCIHVVDLRRARHVVDKRYLEPIRRCGLA
jgi:hypothetical protein